MPHLWQIKVAIVDSAEEEGSWIYLIQWIFCPTLVLAKSKRLGVDFVFPLSQSHSQSQESQPHQKLVVSGKLEVWNFVLKNI